MLESKMPIALTRHVIAIKYVDSSKTHVIAIKYVDSSKSRKEGWLYMHMHKNMHP